MKALKFSRITSSTIRTAHSIAPGLEPTASMILGSLNAAFLTGPFPPSSSCAPFDCPFGECASAPIHLRPPDVSQPVGNPSARIVFRCQLCSQVSPAGTPSVRVVVETRLKSYPDRPRANRIVRPDANGKPKVFIIDDPGGVGREVVREVIACRECAARVGG